MSSPRTGLASLQIFTLQLSVMLNAGVALPRGLEVLTLMGGPMARVANQLLRCVEGGKPLSQGMEEQRKVFPTTYRRVVRVGESTGQMLAVLPALSDSLARQLDTRRRLTGSLAYPFFVLLVSAAMVAFLLFYQLPLLLSSFGGGPQLPFLTRLVLASLKPLALLGALGLAVLVLGGLALSRSERLRSLFLRKLGRFPQLGELLFEYALVQVCSDLSLMVHHGVELTRALRTVLDGGTGWPDLDDALRAVLDKVLHGEELSSALGQQGFPKMLILLLRAGEEFGQLDGAFQQYHTMGQARIDHFTEGFLHMIEPCLHLFMGLVVGTLVLACFLPVYQTMQQI